MATSPRIVWNRNAFRKIRNLPQLKALEEEFAKVGAEAAGEGFVVRSSFQPTRARAAVIAATAEAIQADHTDHVLMGRALDAMKAHGRS